MDNSGGMKSGECNRQPANLQLTPGQAWSTTDRVRSSILTVVLINLHVLGITMHPKAHRCARHIQDQVISVISLSMSRRCTNLKPFYLIIKLAFNQS